MFATLHAMLERGCGREGGGGGLTIHTNMVIVYFIDPFGIFFMPNSCLFPCGKPAVTESRYTAYRLIPWDFYRILRHCFR